MIDFLLTKKFLGYLFVVLASGSILFSNKIANHRVKVYINTWKAFNKPRNEKQIKSAKFGYLITIFFGSIALIVIGVYFIKY